MSTTSTASLYAHRASTTIRTTLYDLIVAINTQADSDDEYLAVETIMQLLDSGRITFVEELEAP